MQSFNREDYIHTLEKENEELKDKLKNLESVAEVRLANWQKYGKELKEAKELIETMLIYQEGLSRMGELKQEAVQFLKEIKENE